MFLTGVKDVDFKILDQLNDRDLLNACQTNKKAQSICSDEDFWQRRYMRVYGRDFASFKNPDRLWKDYYLLTLHYNSKYFSRRALIKVIEKGNSTNKNVDLVNLFILQLKQEHVQYGTMLPLHWNMALDASLKVGNKYLVELFMLMGAKLDNTSIFSAAEGGDMELIKMFINDTNNYDWNMGLIGAARGGHKELVDMFIGLGADDWIGGLRGAAQSGNMDLVNFFINMLKTLGVKNFNEGLIGAAKGGHIDIVNMLIKMRANNWNEALAAAAEGGHMELIDFFRKRGARDLNSAMALAAYAGHRKIIDRLIQLGADDFSKAAGEANIAGNKELMEFLQFKLTVKEEKEREKLERQKSGRPSKRH